MGTEKANEKKVNLGVELLVSVTPHIENLLNREVNIFLIGADIKNKKSMRYKIQVALENLRFTKVNILLPETIFEDQIMLKEFNMLSLENKLAESVDAVVMCIESPGSYTELGAFANHDKLNKKLIVCQDKRYSRAQSFINMGPIKYLKSNTDSIVYYENYNEPFDNKKITNLLKNIREVKKDNEDVTYDIFNPLFSEKYVLALLYVVETIDKAILINIIKKLEVSSNETKKEEIISVFLSSISTLSNKREVKINSINKSYSLTKKGKRRIELEYPPYFVHSNLDIFRIKMLNFKNKKV
ncbi:hypothetical protein DH09_05280 [Bacillaceae bacterium JMAK1]|nr:hypothetical protein DH09_05280 [Bacillaceae bacterium JMAK1]